MAELVVVLIGALTAIFAATIGLKQWDIKKVLAYSTVSQLGYMFVGVGVGRVRGGHVPSGDARVLQGAAVPRLRLGDLRDARGVSPHRQPRRRAGHAQHGRPPAVHADRRSVLMWIATLAIAGIPPFAGFFSKDEILGALFARAQGSTLARGAPVRHSGHARGSTSRTCSASPRRS